MKVDKSIILLAVFCRCEFRTPTVREHGLNACGNRVLGRTFVLKTAEVSVNLEYFSEDAEKIRT
jgi:hypothetical protein